MKRIGLGLGIGFCLLAFLPSSRIAGAGQEAMMGPLTQPTGSSLGTASLKVQAAFGRMPLYFIANQGQMDGRVAYYVQGKRQSLYFTAEGITLILDDAGQPASEGRGRDAGGPMATDRKHKPQDMRPTPPGGDDRTPCLAVPLASSLNRWVVRLDFVGANRGVRPVGQDETGAKVSYFKGKPGEWHTDLPTYSKIIYPGLWPGIDLVYSGDVNRLKYEFVVHPGADPGRIRLAYSGTKALSLHASGELEIETPSGVLRDKAPAGYQEIDGRRVPVAAGYRLENSGAPPDSGLSAATSHYGFRLGAYDRSCDLVIDPEMIISCGYIGGAGEDGGYGVAVDSAGSIYIVGDTGSTESTFPETVGPDLIQNGGSDAFIAKINAAGTGLVYCGYIGGAGDDYGNGLAVDGSGAAYVVGVANSNEASFPVAGGPDLTYNGGLYDAYIAKVNPAGTSLAYCGYIGGSGDDETFGVAVDGSNNAYVAGLTDSTQTTFPVSVGPDLTQNGGYDGFIAKVNASGAGLGYCGYIGGNAYDSVNNLYADSSGVLYLVGVTESTELTFPVSVGPDLSHNGNYDAFVAKLNAAGTSLLCCGYIGGSASDSAYGIVADGLGNAYIGGSTKSTEGTFPVLVGPDLTQNGDRDAFVAEVQASGIGLVFCGYIGGVGIDWGRDVAVDKAGNIYICGYAGSTETTFPVLIGPDPTQNGGTDAFVAKILPGGARLGFCGYIGGVADDTGTRIVLDAAANIYLVGCTYSTESTFPATVGPDLTQNGGMDAYVAKLVELRPWGQRHAVGDFDGDGSDEAAVDFGASGIWLYDGGSWTQLSPADAEALLAADIDGDLNDEILADLGSTGLWLWNAGAWNQLSGVNVEGMAAGDVDADGADEAAGDFGSVGLWLLNSGGWTQLSGVNVEFVGSAEMDGAAGEELLGDFGTTGLWIWKGGVWTQLSGVNADYSAFGNTNGHGRPGARRRLWSNGALAVVRPELLDSAQRGQR